MPTSSYEPDDRLFLGMTLLLLYVLPRSANRPNHSSLKTRKPHVWHLAHRAHDGTDHRGSVGSERRSKERPAMLVLFEGVKLSDS
jgi:hypothetical protein